MQQGTYSPATIIAAMLSGFPPSQGIDPDLQIRAYILAVEDFNGDAVARAAKNFMKGKVSGHNNQFAPSCAAFAEQCRYQELVIHSENHPRIAKEDHEAPVYSEEHRAEMARKLGLLSAHMRGNSNATDELREMGFSDIEAPQKPIDSITH